MDCSDDELGLRVTLKIEECCEIAMVDLRMCLLPQYGLGVKGNTEASRLYHLQIVGAIADGKRFMIFKLEPSLKLFERIGFGVAAENWLAHAARQGPVVDQ